jgi:hypothetical protein
MAKKTSINPYIVTAEHPTFNVMLVGDSGMGKTTMAASAQDHPEMADVLFGNVESGMLSIAHREDIHAVDIKSTPDVAKLVWSIANQEFPSVKTVVIDSVSEWQTINLAENVKEAILAGRNKAGGRDRTEDDAWQEDYLRCTKQIGRLVGYLRDLPVNVILTAHAKFVYPKNVPGAELGGVEPDRIVPALSQALMKTVMKSMDFVWTLDVDPETQKRFLVTVPKGPYLCKTRGEPFLEAIGDVVENPSLPELYDTFVRTMHKKTSKRKRST